MVVSMKEFFNESNFEMCMRYVLAGLFCCLFLTACQNKKDINEVKVDEVFPHKMPEEKPDMPLSLAMERMFDYPSPRVQDNELYTLFKYTKLEGFDYNGGDGTISRRDPSRPILVNGKYYMYYTKRQTVVPPIGASRAAEATDVIPSTDWDLCDIWYATSKDGFTWEEQGIAVARPNQPEVGWRSIATPDILIWKGKYYLYYQAFSEPSGLRGDWCPVSVSVADSPDGPWTLGKTSVVPNGNTGDWDQDVIHDPHPIVYKGKIYLYYKGTYNKWEDKRDKYAVAIGLVPVLFLPVWSSSAGCIFAVYRDSTTVQLTPPRFFFKRSPGYWLLIPPPPPIFFPSLVKQWRV